MSALNGMDWSNEMVMEFLRLYEEEPVIWNPTHEQHRNRNEVYAAWYRIQEKFSGNHSVTELKKKKEGLMSNYRKLKSRARAKMKADAETTYKPEWFAYDTMAKFLDTRKSHERAVNSEYFQGDQSIDYDEHELQDSEIDDDSPTRNHISAIEPLSIHAENISNVSCTSSATTAAINSGLSTKKKRKFNKMVETYKLLKFMSEDQDECVLYSQLVGKKLRALDETTRDIAMLQIDKLIIQLKRQEQRKSLQSYHSGSTGYFTYGVLPSGLSTTPHSQSLLEVAPTLRSSQDRPTSQPSSISRSQLSPQPQSPDNIGSTIASVSRNEPDITLSNGIH